MIKESHKFQVNLRGIIALLSNNLYSAPAVFVRELLQNAVDAIHARRLLNPNAPNGEIEFSIVEGANSDALTLMVEDNGIGLTTEEVHRFLATIGESSKRDDLGAAREDFIGQFGIGLLSCFMVADEIVLVTRSARPDSPAVEWRGRPDGTYTVRELPKKGARSEGGTGTRVFLRCRKGAEEFYSRDRIRGLVLHYGGLLPIALFLSGGGVGGGRVQINQELPPWRHTIPPTREQFLEYGHATFDTDFLDAIPLRSKAGDADGVAFVLTHSPSPSANLNHRLYLKNMLVSEHAQNLLPPWAFFIQCVVNANKLRPTASRESFYEDAALEKTREELGQCLRRWLLQLARQRPERMQKFIGVHYLAIKSLAIHDDEFYRLFIDMLPFETSRGYATLQQVRAEQDKIIYAPTVDQFRQIAAVAQAQNLWVINAGYAYDRELLEKFPDFYPDVTVERIDAETISQSFEDLTLDEREKCFDMLKAADTALTPSRCQAQVRRFGPATLVALYSISDEGLFFRSARGAAEKADDHWAGILSNAVGTGNKMPYAQLCFNYNNELTRRLVCLKDKKLLRRLIELLYVQSLLAGHHPLATHEMKMLNQGLMDLITLTASSEEPEKE